MKFARLVLVLGALTTLVLSAQAHQADKITFETPGASVDKIVSELAVRTGRPLKTSASMHNEIVAAHFTDVPVDTALQKLAEALNAIWTNDGQAVKLSRTSSQMQAEEKAEELRLARGYAEAIAQRRKALAALQPFDEREVIRFADHVKLALDNPTDPRHGEIIESLQRQGPSGRTFGRILGSLDPHIFADLPLRIKVVFSTDPTPTERPLPTDVSDIVAEFLHEQNLWAHEVEARHMESSLNGTPIYRMPMNVDGPNLNASTPAKVLLTAFTFRKNGPVMLELIIADGKGAIVGRTSDSISPIFYPSEAPKMPSGDKQLEIPATTFQLLTGFGYHASVPTDLRNALLHPDQIDPLAIAAGPLALQCAELEGENAIAVLSDENLGGGIQAGTKSMTVDGYVSQLENREVEVLNDGAWILFKPKNPGFVRDHRADRAVLGEMLRLQDSEGDLGVDAQAKYAYELPAPLDNAMPREIQGCLSGQPTLLSDDSFLRFYGSLDSNQRQAAMSSDGLPISSLGDTQRNLMDPIVYASYADLQLRGNASQFVGIWRMPTQVMPNGIPSSGNIRLSVSSRDAVINTKDSPMHRAFDEGAYTAGELAGQIFAKAHPEKAPWVRGPALDVDQPLFKLGSVETYDLTLNFTSKLFLKNEMKARHLASGDPVALASLPASFQDQVQRELATLIKDSGQGDPGISKVSTP